MQDSLLKALKSTARPTDADGAVTWFYRILRRSIIDGYRRGDARNRALKHLEADWDNTPSKDDASLICQCFKHLLPTLPPQYRVLLQRVDLDETPSKIVARSLQITMNNLDVRLPRAQKQLREKLEDVCRVCSKHGCLDCTCQDGAAK